MTFDEVAEKLPLKVLLDTTVIQNVCTFGDYIFENWLSPELENKLSKLPQKMQDDIHNLRTIIGPTLRTPVVPIISNLSMEELLQTGNAEKCHNLVDWGFRLIDYNNRIGHCNLASISQTQTILYDYLPGRMDRLLIGECKRNKCEAFITMDYRTILKFREQILHYDRIKVLSPTEWWNILAPWFNIWV